MNFTTKEKFLLVLFGIVTFSTGWLIWDLFDLIIQAITALTGGGS